MQKLIVFIEISFPSSSLSTWVLGVGVGGGNKKVRIVVGERMNGKMIDNHARQNAGSSLRSVVPPGQI